jgi:hypothetical protein
MVVEIFMPKLSGLEVPSFVRVEIFLVFVLNAYLSVHLHLFPGVKGLLSKL